MLGQPTSTLSTLTITLKGNGEIVLASVIGGTAARPFSDEVCVIIVWIAFVRVKAKAVRAFSRSGYRNKLDGTLICVGGSPFSVLGCRNSAFMTLNTPLGKSHWGKEKR